MKPVKFAEQNVIYAEHQPEYQPLPSHKTADGEVITCWGLDWRERLLVLFTGRVWWRTLTFGGPLQPQMGQIDNPFKGKP